MLCIIMSSSVVYFDLLLDSVINSLVKIGCKAWLWPYIIPVLFGLGVVLGRKLLVFIYKTNRGLYSQNLVRKDIESDATCTSVQRPGDVRNTRDAECSTDEYLNAQQVQSIQSESDSCTGKEETEPAAQTETATATPVDQLGDSKVKSDVSQSFGIQYVNNTRRPFSSEALTKRIEDKIPQVAEYAATGKVCDDANVAQDKSTNDRLFAPHLLLHHNLRLSRASSGYCSDDLSDDMEDTRPMSVAAYDADKGDKYSTNGLLPPPLPPRLNSRTVQQSSETGDHRAVAKPVKKTEVIVRHGQRKWKSTDGSRIFQEIGTTVNENAALLQQVEIYIPKGADNLWVNDELELDFELIHQRLVRPTRPIEEHCEKECLQPSVDNGSPRPVVERLEDKLLPPMVERCMNDCPLRAEELLKSGHPQPVEERSKEERNAQHPSDSTTTDEDCDGCARQCVTPKPELCERIADSKAKTIILCATQSSSGSDGSGGDECDDGGTEDIASCPPEEMEVKPLRDAADPVYSVPAASGSTIPSPSPPNTSPSASETRNAWNSAQDEDDDVEDVLASLLDERAEFYQMLHITGSENLIEISGDRVESLQSELRAKAERFGFNVITKDIRIPASDGNYPVTSNWIEVLFGFKSSGDLALAVSGHRTSIIETVFEARDKKLQRPTEANRKDHYGLTTAHSFLSEKENKVLMASSQHFTEMFKKVAENRCRKMYCVDVKEGGKVDLTDNPLPLYRYWVSCRLAENSEDENWTVMADTAIFKINTDHLHEENIYDRIDKLINIQLHKQIHHAVPSGHEIVPIFSKKDVSKYYGRRVVCAGKHGRIRRPVRIKESGHVLGTHIAFELDDRNDSFASGDCGSFLIDEAHGKDGTLPIFGMYIGHLRDHPNVHQAIILSWNLRQMEAMADFNVEGIQLSKHRLSKPDNLDQSLIDSDYGSMMSPPQSHSSP